MSTLYLIRHGQAGFAQADYDVLSPLGARQTAQLGGYCSAAELTFDALYCAPRRRHRESAEHLRAAAHAAGRPLPEPLPTAGFDEFPFAEILHAACQADLADEYARLSAALDGKSPLHDGRSFTRLFQLAMAEWTAGRLAVSESFAEFRARVDDGLQQILRAEGRGRKVAIVTSAGAISAVLMQALDLSPAHMLKLCLGLYNSGISELRYHPPELSVITINAVPHLLAAADRTFR